MCFWPIFALIICHCKLEFESRPDRKEAQSPDFGVELFSFYGLAPKLEFATGEKLPTFRGKQQSLL